MIKGLDVASYQHPNGAAINWHEVKADGYEFVMVKASEGVGYVNPFFKQDVADARAAGLKVGAYHFFRANVDGVAQANKFLEVTDGIHFDLPLGIDYETNDGEGASLAHERLDQVRTVLRQHGHRTMTYTYPNFWENYGNANCSFCASDPLWFSETGIKEAPAAPRPWRSVTIWQYAGDSVSVPGIQGRNDADGFLGDQEQFDVFTGTKPPAPHKEQPLPSWYHRLLEYPPAKLRNAGQVHEVHGVKYQWGPDVGKVQRKLAIKPDQLYGPTTAAHVKGFQHAHGLHPDGIVGPDTARKLGD